MNFTFEDTAIPSVKLIHQFRAEDNRGTFVKTFHNASMQEAGIDFILKESFYSISNKDVIRGMHFHHPPFDHAKLVFCTSGKILDIALDLRKNSKTYGQYVTAILSFENNQALYIPKGFAHGFVSLEDNTTTFYFVDGVYHKASDDGVRYDSFGLDWSISNPILSDRDCSFVSLADFKSPF